jgi:uncharacterized protein YjbI with pentapeptide repeats
MSQWQHSRHQGSDFADTDLAHADLSHLYGRDCRFVGAGLSRTRLHETDVDDGAFAGADTSAAEGRNDKLFHAERQGLITESLLLQPLS